MPIWMIYPVARPEDSRWQGRDIWDRVVVRAPTASRARVQAAKLDRLKVSHRLGNETLCFRSGLEDERLYWVRRVTEEEAEFYTDEETMPQESAVLDAIPADTVQPMETGQEVHNGRTSIDR